MYFHEVYYWLVCTLSFPEILTIMLNPQVSLKGTVLSPAVYEYVGSIYWTQLSDTFGIFYILAKMFVKTNMRTSFFLSSPFLLWLGYWEIMSKSVLFSVKPITLVIESGRAWLWVPLPLIKLVPHRTQHTSLFPIFLLFIFSYKFWLWWKAGKI